MPYQIEDEDGKLNNFAVEPPMYKADPETDNNKKSMAIAGIFGGVLVTALIAVTFVISG
ncbi:hypothetical protein Lepto7376_2518 [[Leptolyngbya] sp. PCC 7376]|uniref:photosystem II assembly protein Psb34 n=1 Tax=[Leptolyngbya] sp. PCC 7376 TaxID=111781 RepID=UPI00029F239D|nr:ssl1498 family light-harvesting-like protein [[Leptolyngbya] sp. PCC 7376]AFY38792.1 hypothetical protein Lepto7376_2518 [[Leptolyngbya] sp. PCC 7376]